MRTLLLYLLLISAALSPAAAQWTVVPANVAGDDANSNALIAGFNLASREQILIDERRLGTALRNQWLRGLSFRRDASAPYAFAGGQADLSITLSIAPRTALRASETMAENHDPVPANRVQVFTGRVTLPPSPAPHGRTVGWSNPHDVVEIRFQQPFHYRGGTLCIDVLGQPTIGQECRFWAVDGIWEAELGQVAHVGHACGPFRGRSGPGRPLTTASISPVELVPGMSATFNARGDAGRAAVLLIGFRSLAVDLHALGVGGPGCVLRVDPVLGIPDVFVDRSRYGLASGGAIVPVRIPTTRALFRARFIAQFVQVDTPVLTSNAMHCELAGALPTLGMATVRAPYDGVQTPAVGRVNTGKAPVVRIGI